MPWGRRAFIDMDKLLDIHHLSVSFKNGSEQAKAVQDLCLCVHKGEVVGLAGESGSGKSVTALAVAGLLSHGPKIKVEGDIFFNREKLSTGPRGSFLKSQKISMIFQDPIESLNPSLTIGNQIDEVFRLRKQMRPKSARKYSLALLEKVRIPFPRTVAGQYPHQLSGGMCQRVMIAIALAAEPDLLIADEPTTALDVTIQAEILALLHQLHNTKTAILFISHDLGIMAQFCDVAAIMLKGQIVEKARVGDIFKNPGHPYTKGLLNSIPVPGKNNRLIPIPRDPGINLEKGGCRFYPRCSRKKQLCRMVSPELIKTGPDHFVRCHMGDNL